MRNKVFFFAALLFMMSASCATVFSGRADKVKVHAGNPAEAKVYYNGSYVGNAPCTVRVPKADLKHNTATITIKMEGYDDQVIQLTRKLKLGAVVMDCLTGFIWLAVDFADSAIYKSGQQDIKYDLSHKSLGDDRRRQAPQYSVRVVR